MFTDNFDRAVLGDDWVTPGRYGTMAGWGTPPTPDNLIISEPGLVIQNTDYNSFVGCAAYTGLGELGNSGQFAEITIGNALEQRDNRNKDLYYAQHAYYLVYLHSPPAADESRAWTGLRLWQGYYGPYGPPNPNSHGPFYADLIVVNSAGTITDHSSPQYYWSMADLGFANEPFLLNGTKLRLEHVSGDYYGYIKNPNTGAWTLLMTVNNSIASADGYPGFGMGSYANAGVLRGATDYGEYPASVSQFRCGQTVGNDTFLTSNSLTAADNASRSLARGLSKDLFASSNGLIRGISSSGPADEYFNKVKLLPSFDYADGATTASDNSNTAETGFTFVGDAQIDTGVTRYDQGTLLLDGTGDVLQIDHDAGYSIPDDDGTGDSNFTVEIDARWASDPGTANQCLVSKFTNTGSLREWYFGLRNNVLTVIISTASNGIIVANPAFNPVAEQWYTFCFEIRRDAGDRTDVYVDGVLLQSHNGIGSWPNIGSRSGPVRIGGWESGSAIVEPFNGNLANLRITTGVAGGRHGAATYTPPSAPYPVR